MEIEIDDISPQINYITTGTAPLGEKGTWDNGYKQTDPNYVKYAHETMTRTTGEANQAVFEFNATSIKVFGSKWFNHCPYSVQIDDRPTQDLDGWVQNREYNAELAAANNLEANKLHSITITNHPSKNTRPGKDAALGWFDIDYITLKLDVQGQIRTSRIDDVAPAFTYDGVWAPTTPEGYNGNTAHQTSILGASATLFFTGMSVQLFGGLSSRHGQYAILLDGVEASRKFNAVMHTDVANVPLYTASGLQDGPHTLQIVNRGIGGRDAIIDIDYAIVNTTLTADAPLFSTSPTDAGAAPSISTIPSLSGGLPPLPSTVAPTPSSINTYTLPGPSTASSSSGPLSGPNFGASPGRGSGSAAASEGISSHPSTPPGVIAGIAVGGIVMIAILGLAVWFLRRRLQAEERSASVWAASTERNGTYYGGGGAGAEPGQSASGYAFAHGHGPGQPQGHNGFSASRDMLQTPFGCGRAPQGPLRVMNPSQTRSSISSRVSSFLGRSVSQRGDSGGGGGSAVGASGPSGASRKEGGSGYGWEYERDRSFDPFDDMSEINGPTAFVQRVHTPSGYAQQQFDKYGERLEGGVQRGNSVYSGYASEKDVPATARTDSMRR